MTKEKAKQIISAHGLGYTIEEWDKAIAVTFNDEPSLQSDVTKAAKDYARCYTESDNGNGGDDWEDDISIAFTAGARWLAEKGVTMSIDDNTEWADVDSFVHRNVDGKTVIQIR